MYIESDKARMASVRLKTLANRFDSNTGIAEIFANNPRQPGIN